jgi:hypothetical protein
MCNASLTPAFLGLYLKIQKIDSDGTCTVVKRSENGIVAAGLPKDGSGKETIELPFP